MDESRQEYERVDPEVRRAALRLRDADAETIAAETVRLRQLTERIDDEIWRRRAISRVERLAELAAGPAGGQSAEFRSASLLVSRAIAANAPAADRIAEIERIRPHIGELAGRAPENERLAILHLNSALSRVLDELRRTQRGQPKSERRAKRLDQASPGSVLQAIQQAADERANWGAREARST